MIILFNNTRTNAHIEDNGSSMVTVANHGINAKSKNAQQSTAPSLLYVLGEQQQPQRRKCAIFLYGLPRAFQALVLPSLERHVIRPNVRYDCDYYVHAYHQTSEPAGRSGSGGRVQGVQDLLQALPAAVERVWYEHYGNNRTVAAVEANNIHTPKEGDAATISSSLLLSSPPTVHFALDTEEDFWKQYGTYLRDTIHAAKDDRNRPYYEPWNESTYTATTVDNIFKMWHSMQAAWQLAVQVKRGGNVRDDSKRNSNNNHHHDDNPMDLSPYYHRVAMLRSDVVYMTPMDIWKRGGGNIIIPSADDNDQDDEDDDDEHTTTTTITDASSFDEKPFDVTNTHAVIPGFGRYPISDRAMYGPTTAVQVWATERFRFLPKRAAWCARHDPGMTLQSERFVQHLLSSHLGRSAVAATTTTTTGDQNSPPSPPQQQQLLLLPQYSVEEDSTMCFLRARVDYSIWIQDCDAHRKGWWWLKRWFTSRRRHPHSVAYESIHLPTDRRGWVEDTLGRSCGHQDLFQVPSGAWALPCPP